MNARCVLPLVAMSLGVATLHSQTSGVSTTGTAAVHFVATAGPNGPALALPSIDTLQLEVDGQLVAIRSLVPAGDPTLVVIVDASVSVSLNDNRFPSPLIGVIERGLIGHLAPGDRVRFGLFSNTLTLQDASLSDKAKLRDSLRAMMKVRDQQRYGPSPLWDALDTTLTMLDRESGLRSVILVTDGEATGNTRSRVDVLRHATLSGVSVSTVGALAVQSRARASLREVATDTGGRLVDPDTLGRRARTNMIDAVEDSLALLLDDLHHTYRLTFTPPSTDGADHTLELRSLSTDVHIHAPRTFNAGR